MNDPYFEYAFLPARGEIVRHQFLDVVGPESMEIQCAIDRDLDWIVIVHESGSNLSVRRSIDSQHFLECGLSILHIGRLDDEVGQDLDFSPTVGVPA